jgi:hypothetical protein
MIFTLRVLLIGYVRWVGRQVNIGGSGGRMSDLGGNLPLGSHLLHLELHPGLDVGGAEAMEGLAGDPVFPAE